MKQILQNHPNRREYPVNSIKVIKDKLTSGEKITSLLSPYLAILGTVFVIIACFGIFLSVFAISEFNQIAEKEFAYIVWCATSVCLFVLSLIAYQVVNIPKKEQLHYYKKAGITPLPLNKEQALSLCRVGMYYDGFWLNTLEHYPLKSRVQNDNYSYKTIYLSQTSDHTSQLYSDWGIVDKKDYEEMLSKIIEGLHSREFAFSMSSKEFQPHIKKLAALIVENDEYIYSCVRSKNGNAPTLLWGFDLLRAITLSRNCFCAGIITEEQAWTDILKVADYIYAIFDNFDDFYTNYRLGNAFWSNDMNMAREKVKQYNTYKTECNWPVKNMEWPKNKNIELPIHMATGFILEINAFNQQKPELN